MRTIPIAAGVAGLVVSCMAIAGPVRAQEDGSLAERCAAAGLEESTPEGNLCRDVAAGVRALQPEAGMLLAGGNPVLGTTSPIGSRFRLPPRFSLGLRVNLVFIDVPDVLDYAQPGEPVDQLGFAVPMPQLDLAVGLFDGVELTPTTRGLGAVDLLVSYGVLILPEGEGFRRDIGAPGLGARIGVLRESFTTPGLSISGMYRWIDRVQFGNLEEGDDAQFGVDLRTLSFRAGVSKQFLILGLAAGVGWDRYESDVDFAIRGDAVGLPADEITVIPEEEPAGLEEERWSVFANGSYVLLFLHLVGELGWQQSESVTLSTGDEVESGNLFASLGIRISG